MTEDKWDLEERLLEYAAEIIRFVEKKETDELTRIFVASIRTARAQGRSTRGRTL
ncbi:MAG: hypothetical protein HY343_11625 [Lentisphaerae bacterium]|nr:hypothetical protein [Lentisphaerota bacterium]